MNRVGKAIVACVTLGALTVAALGSPPTAVAKRHPTSSPSSSISPGPTPSPKPTPSPSLSPGAQPPTPYMPLEVIANGSWLVIEQGPQLPSYSSMTLKDTGSVISGRWQRDKKTVYYISGTRTGSHLTLDLRATSDGKTPAVGKIDATLDGIADMYGFITLGGVDTPFQGAQHSRVPPPVEPANESPSPNPYGP